MQGDLLGVPASAENAHHPIPDLQRANTFATTFDFAGELQPRNLLGHAGRGGVEAASLKQIGAIDPGCAHANDDVFRFCFDAAGRVQTASGHGALAIVQTDELPGFCELPPGQYLLEAALGRQ